MIAALFLGAFFIIGEEKFSNHIVTDFGDFLLFIVKNFDLNYLTIYGKCGKVYTLRIAKQFPILTQIKDSPVLSSIIAYKILNT